MSDPTDQSRGTVIFCCPNAGLYECIAMSIGLPCSWNSFYYSLGFNLVYFNYRGYGRSAGVPTPARVKGDAERVIECVQREWPSHRILVHGESLGGMVACHLARKYKIDLLVCDRTFASLDGVANRMLGTWAGLGLKYLGFWFTNVVSDYLAADCHKVILQDPKDEIIAFPASLRSGVSSFLTLRDSQWSIRSVPHSFQVSLALFNQKLSLKLNVETSNSLLSSQFLSSPILSLSPSIFKQSPSEMLEPLRNAVSGSFTIQSDVWSIISEDLIGYLFACLSAANLQFRAIAMYRKQSRNRSPQLGRRKESTGVTSDLNELHFPTPKRAGKIVLSSLQEEEAPSETNRLLDRDISNGKNSSLPTSALDTTVRSEANSFSSSSRASSGDRSSSGSSSSGVDIDTTQDNAYLNIADGIGLDLNGGDVTTTDESLLADQELYARHYQSFNTNDPYLHPVEKLWFILTRIDLNEGQALGPAFKRGYDTFRVWLTNALVWNTQYRPADISTRTGTGSKMSTPNSHRSGNGCNSKGIQVDSSLSVNQYLEVYRVIYTEFAASVDSIDSVESIDILMRREDIRLCDMLFFILEAFSLVTAYCTAAKVNMGSNGSLLDVEQGVSSGVGVDVDKDTIASTPSSYQHGSGNSSRNIGHTITLSTGHSGWPSEVELNTLRGEMRLAGFHV